jgi:adenine-specific DNA-methyltransferase
VATGLPKTQWNGDQTLSPAAEHPLEPSKAVLCYEGKRSENAVLMTRPAEILPLWRDPHLSGDDPGNRLFFGDNLPVLARLFQDPLVRGKVRLVYIDPPFATKSVFQSRAQADAYSDLLIGAHYIEFIRERLIFLRELLSDDGSIYIHLDENMAFHIKVVMDEVFGAENYRNWITRKKCNPKNYTRKTYGNVSDFILFYTKSAHYVWNRPFDDWTPDRAQKEYQYVEEMTGRRYKKVPLHAPGVRNGETGKPWRGVNPPLGKHWQFPPRVLDEMDARGEIYWSPNDNPRRKIYLENSNGIPVQDIWLDFRDAHNQNIEITGYPTEKNPDLLQRIIGASSDPGDLVLDCFAGSGTTLAVASQLGRRWIGIDKSAQAIGTTLRRFGKGLERMGDFVDKSKAAQDGITEETLPLFDDLEGEASPVSLQAAVKQVNQITDFALMAVQPYAGELDSVLNQWQEWAGAVPLEEVS